MAHQLPFQWETDRWYRVKLRVEASGKDAIILGKAWLKEDLEPKNWTISAKDPYPIRRGSPALIGNSPSPVHYDNVKVTQNP